MTMEWTMRDEHTGCSEALRLSRRRILRVTCRICRNYGIIAIVAAVQKDADQRFITAAQIVFFAPFTR